MRDLFNGHQGFLVQFDETEIKLDFRSKEVLELCDGMLVFGPPFNSSRRYNLAFGKDRTNTNYLKQIYWQLARETYGDAFSSSSALLQAYHQRVIAITSAELERSLANDQLLSFKETEKSELFFRVFDSFL